jgi:hypothetical protein
MRNRVLWIGLVMAHASGVCGQGAFEQYYYVQKNQPVTLVPVVHIQNSRNWYVEARYNYEELRSASLYIGKNFSKEIKSFYYSVTPVIGGVAGKFTGGSVGVNLQMEYEKFFFYSQSQFTFTQKARGNDFVFSWAELGVEPLPWMFFGLSLQYTHDLWNHTNMTEEGIVVGFNFRRWTFPLYGFNLQDQQRYFILGINLGIGQQKKNRLTIK